MAETTIGIDIGTTSVKAVAADGDGTIVARTQVHHDVAIPTPTRFEHDTGAIWRHGVQRALADLGDLGDLGARAVNVSAMVPSLGAFGAGGAHDPLGPGLLYGDERGARYKGPDSDEREAEAFLEWLVEAHPDASHFWPAQAAANHALCGRGVIDTTTCASLSPLWFGTSWNPEVLERLGVDAAALPDAADLGAAVGALAGTSDVTVASGSIDAMGEQIVSGADQPGDVLVILGTTLITWGVIDDWNIVDGLWTIPSMTVPKMFIGGPSNAGGLFTTLVRSMFGDGAPDGSDQDDVDPVGVPLWAPFPRGERVPLHDAGRRAVLANLDLSHDAAAVRRAAFEASGFTVRRILDAAVSGGAYGDATPPRRIVATGGGTRVPAWTRALADATGLPVDVVAVPEGGALGSAWFARMAAGLEPDGMAAAPRWASTGQRIEPDDRWLGPTSDRYEEFLALCS